MLSKATIVVHGGAWKIPASLSAASLRGVEAAARAGGALLRGGGSALDAVERAVRSLEDDEAFNCGRGSVFTAAGTQEMDASVMTGDLACGAVSGLSRTRNPIRAARYVMESTPHVFFARLPPPSSVVSASFGIRCKTVNSVRFPSDFLQILH